MQVLDNLVDNAHKFTALAGQDPEIELRVGREGEWAVLEVTDNGPGIRPSQRERLFAPFARSESPEARGVPGMGLGLSVVERIVRAHGGDVTCDDGRGPGCCFRVRLPRRGRAPRGLEEGDRERAGSRGGVR
jgi:two-component system OmpR family sensor kinase